MLACGLLSSTSACTITIVLDIVIASLTKGWYHMQVDEWCVMLYAKLQAVISCIEMYAKALIKNRIFDSCTSTKLCAWMLLFITHACVMIRQALVLDNVMCT